jgi:hypothetical protein
MFILGDFWYPRVPPWTMTHIPYTLPAHIYIYIHSTCSLSGSSTHCFTIASTISLLVFLSLTLVDKTTAMAAHSTDLSSINKSSVKLASWVGRVTFGHTHSYKYTAKRTGVTVVVHKFECRLVGNSESTYVFATYKGNEKAVETAKDKFKNGSIWILSQIKFEENSLAQYISSPLKVSVDLAKSNLQPSDDPEMENLLAEVSVPPRTVAETTHITSNRNQDLLAILTHVSPVRQTKSGDVVDVTIMDASEDTPGIFAKVLVSVIGSSKHPLLVVGKALVFFNLVCKVDKDNKQYTHWENSLLCEAPPCEKRTKLTAEFDELKGAVNTVMLTKFTPKQSVDVSGLQSIAACAFVDYTAHNPAAKLPPVMQLMLLTIEEPTSESVVAEGTDRIWFNTKLRDNSGSAEVGVPERVALHLTGLEKQAFIDAHAASTLQFPLLCNIRVSRQVSPGQSGASQPGVGFVNTVIQDAQLVNWSNRMEPNAAYENVLATLNDLPRNEEGLNFAFLSDIRADPHCGYRLAFSNDNIVKGAAVAVLIASSKKAKPPETFGTGYKVCAPDVCDIACPDAEKKPGMYNVSGFCTLEDMGKFDLTPPRGHKQRFAIAFITKCEETSGASQPAVKTFHMDKIQILEQGDGPKAVRVFQRLRRVTMRLNPSSTEERKHTLTIDEDKQRPLKQCKTLSAMPSDASLSEG